MTGIKMMGIKIKMMGISLFEERKYLFLCEVLPN